MQNQTNKNFGNLIKKNQIIEKSISFGENAINFLFDDSKKNLDELGVIETERTIALEQLRSLTTKLQVQNLRNKIKSSSNYFTL